VAWRNAGPRRLSVVEKPDSSNPAQLRTRSFDLKVLGQGLMIAHDFISLFQEMP